MAEPRRHWEMLLPSHVARRNAWKIHERFYFEGITDVLPGCEWCVCVSWVSLVTREEQKRGSEVRWHCQLCCDNLTALGPGWAGLESKGVEGWTYYLPQVHCRKSINLLINELINIKIQNIEKNRNIKDKNITIVELFLIGETFYFEI